MTCILDEFEDTRCPMLVFADPFGIKYVPMELMRRVVNRPVTELFLNVMFSSAIRWVNSSKHNNAFNEFLDEENCDWKKTVFKDDENKTESFIRYYVEKLIEHEHIYHHIFGMKDNRNRHIYQLVYTTKHFNALITMKTAMINNSQETNRFVYSEFIENNPERGLSKMTKEDIKMKLVEMIKEKFKGEIVHGRTITRFVWEDTPFIFNLKVELKKEFKKFVVNQTNQFGEMIFNF